MSCLFERFGGDAALQTAATDLYRRIMADPTLKPFFRGVDIETQTKKMVGFLRMAMGGPHEYTGQDLRTAHVRLVAEQGLDDSHFDAVVEHLEATLTMMAVDEDLCAQALELIASTHGDVLGRTSGGADQPGSD